MTLSQGKNNVDNSQVCLLGTESSQSGTWLCQAPALPPLPGFSSSPYPTRCGPGGEAQAPAWHLYLATWRQLLPASHGSRLSVSVTCLCVTCYPKQQQTLVTAGVFSGPETPEELSWCFWSSASCDRAVRVLSAGTAVIRRLDWGWRLCFSCQPTHRDGSQY